MSSSDEELQVGACSSAEESAREICAGSSDEEKKERWPLWKLAIIGLPQLGVQLLWVFLGPNTAPYLTSLGASDSFAAWNNSAGPIVGFFVGPIVGTWSDQSTSKWGRRRPVIVGGLIATAVAGLLYGAAKPLFGKTPTAMYLAASMQWGLDFTVNVMQTPIRAFVADLASEDQQFLMQMWFTVVCSIGVYGAYYIMQLFIPNPEHMLELMGVVIVINAVFIGLALVVGREKQFKRMGSDSACGALTGIWSTLKDLHVAFYILIAVLCLLWFGNTVWGSYGKVWFTDSVWAPCNATAPEGSTAYEKYHEAAEAFSAAGEWGAGLSLLLAFVLMGLSFTPIPHHFIFAPLVFVGAIVCYLSAFQVGHSGTMAKLSLILSNIPLGAAGSIPYGIVAVWNSKAEKSGKSSLAMQMAIVNCCITVGQQVCHTVLGTFETSNPVPEALKQLFTYSMVANGVAAIGALFLGLGKKSEELTESESDESSGSE
eukprot:CAMPEP_0113843416 /NCGR_PEP_ID=MMETSP0328-20130328/13241_1 /TAXON_ID=39455 /ORGANISM="Alexandrium minutum" /LENGTH=484 /DNA_ID=CAMNT_0000812375 /DNA_START=74 /DNA_END=1528 /DNA_ORIENTATION=+ /assembly_acc=CAM_ASM_000350